MTATILPKLPIADYVLDKVMATVPTLSSSIAHLMLSRSPAHAREVHPKLNPAWLPDESRDFDLGIACHCVLLEGKTLSPLPFDNYRTKAAQTARDNILAVGGIPVLSWQGEAVEKMCASTRTRMRASQDLESVDVTKLQPEATIVWQEGETWCRCRPDWLTPARDVIFSLKTAGNAEPDAFMRGPLIAHSYDLQAAFELAAVKAATGVDAHYVYVVVETDPPYACSLIGLSPEWRDFSHRKFRAAVQMWADCLASGVWPDYGDRIFYLDVPPWLQARAVERGQVTLAEAPVDDGRDISEQLFGGDAP